SRQRYVLGAISITDLTIAQREKDAALRSYIQTLRSYWIAFYTIRRLTAYDFISDGPIQYQIQ
ncbi:MAG: TolC family protein, partial [Bacteroidota bacterium]